MTPDQCCASTSRVRDVSTIKVSLTRYGWRVVLWPSQCTHATLCKNANVKVLCVKYDFSAHFYEAVLGTFCVSCFAPELRGEVVYFVFRV